MPRPLPIVFLLFLLFFPASKARAHLVVGDSALFSGMLNSLVHVPLVMLLFAFGCRAGQHFNRHPPPKASDLRWFLAAVFTGAVLGKTVVTDLPAPGMAMALAGFNGLLTALNYRGTAVFLRILGVLCAVTAGLYSVEELSMPWYKEAFFICGVLIIAATMVFFTAYPVSVARGRPAQIGVRIAGSWIAAVAAMMLTYALL